MSSIKIEDLANSIAKELSNYSKGVEVSIQKEINALSKEILNGLKNESVIPEKTGMYKKSFYISQGGRVGSFSRVIIANRQYRLTHLLEYGHVTQSGSRTKAYPHWEKAQKKAETIKERIEAII